MLFLVVYGDEANKHEPGFITWFQHCVEIFTFKNKLYFVVMLKTTLSLFYYNSYGIIPVFEKGTFRLGAELSWESIRKA